jgi:hypothetical protein
MKDNFELDRVQRAITSLTLALSQTSYSSPPSNCVPGEDPIEDTDLIYLLLHHRHAFHLSRVDHWLESNAGCPLYCASVDSDDARLDLSTTPVHTSSSGVETTKTMMPLLL